MWDVSADRSDMATDRQISAIYNMLERRHVRRVTAEKIIALLSEEHEQDNGLGDLKEIQRNA